MTTNNEDVKDATECDCEGGCDCSKCDCKCCDDK